MRANKPYRTSGGGYEFMLFGNSSTAPVFSYNQINKQIENLESNGQEKSTKILISWQVLKNQCLLFLAHR